MPVKETDPVIQPFFGMGQRSRREKQQRQHDEPDHVVQPMIKTAYARNAIPTPIKSCVTVPNSRCRLSFADLIAFMLESFLQKAISGFYAKRDCPPTPLRRTLLCDLTCDLKCARWRETQA